MTVVDPQEFKKQWYFSIPVITLFFVLCFYMTFSRLPQQLDSIFSQPPLIRIFPGLILGPYFFVLSSLTVVIQLFIIIPGWSKYLPKFGRVVNFLAFLGLGLMILLIISKEQTQAYYMSKMGYTECQILEGKPSIWFSDWVKNPEWCVKGKSPEWVFEKAGLPGSLARQ